jgi:hypothetical protein
MMAWNSKSVPLSTSADPASRTWITARSVAATAVAMKSTIFTRLTGTPTLRAATGSPPVPKIQFPNVVRSKT